MDCLDAKLFVEAFLQDPHYSDDGERDDFQRACDHVHICGCEGCRETVDLLAGYQTTMAVA